MNGNPNDSNAPGTPVTTGGEDNTSAVEPDVIGYADNSGTPITAGGEASLLDGGTPVTTGGDG